MPITEPIPGLQVFDVTATISAYDELTALALDHLLDHLHALTLIASTLAIPDAHTHACLAAHPRYQPLLDGSRPSNASLIQQLLDESQLLLLYLIIVTVAPPADKPLMFRRLRSLVPYLAHTEAPPPAD